MSQVTDLLLQALAEFTCDDKTLVRYVKDTLQILDRDLEEAEYEPSKLADKQYEELETYLEELNSYVDDDEDEEDDNDVDDRELRDIEEDNEDDSDEDVTT